MLDSFLTTASLMYIIYVTNRQNIDLEFIRQNPVYNVAFDFYPRFKNFSNLVLDQGEVDLLNKGFKYGYHETKVSKRDVMDLAADCEVALSSISLNCSKEKFGCKKVLVSMVNESVTRQRTVGSEICTLKALKGKIVDNEVVICKADKGNTVTLLNRNEYVDKMKDYIVNNNLVVTKEKHILNKYVAKVKKCISECPQILKGTPNVSNPQIPKLYGLPKLHKEGNPLRPVVSCVDAPSSEICKKFISVLPELLKFKSKYSINNNLCLIEKLKKVPKLPTNAKLISFDVKNLFPSIPINELKSIILNGTIHLSQSLKMEINKCLEVCLDQNFCTFQDVIYEIKKGLPIGSPISPLMAEIFMNHIENKIFNLGDPLISSIIYWYRYVDDVFAVVTCSKRQLNLLLRTLNTVNPHIQFTMELEENKSLNFLDLTIMRIQDQLEFSIYRKATCTDTVINKQSNHPDHIKYSAFFSMIHRLISVPMSVENYFKELSIIYTIAENNGYDRNEINVLLLKKLKKQKQELLYPKTENQDDVSWRKIKFVNKKKSNPNR
uniref:Reverse transcriptase domain-containing protein n=1 Tax=Cacopsylla melanoneura TaxID=428564 RepID=A0A8D8WUJ8_9HEMI